jgi:hypothetical protein
MCMSSCQEEHIQECCEMAIDCEAAILKYDIEAASCYALLVLTGPSMSDRQTHHQPAPYYGTEKNRTAQHSEWTELTSETDPKQQ